MLGDLIYEHKGKVTGQRVLDVSPPRVETSFSEIGQCHYWQKQALLLRILRELYPQRNDQILQDVDYKWMLFETWSNFRCS